MEHSGQALSCEPINKANALINTRTTQSEFVQFIHRALGAPVESTLLQAENTADNVHFLCGLSRRRYECLIRTAKQLRYKLQERVSLES